jgi:sulfate/thiosulfate transport system permease protein
VSRTQNRNHRVLPGFGLTLGFTLLYTSLLVLIPLAGLFYLTSRMTWEEFVRKGGDRSARARLLQAELRRAFIAALDQRRFRVHRGLGAGPLPIPGQALVDALVDLPFALPTAVSGIALTTLYAHTGWIGRWLDPLGIQSPTRRPGIVIALTLIGLPFVVRTVQPALEDLDRNWRRPRPAWARPAGRPSGA